MNNLKHTDEIDKVEELKEADFEENNEELEEKFAKPKVRTILIIVMIFLNIIKLMANKMSFQ